METIRHGQQRSIMANESLHWRSGISTGVSVTLIKLPDRRESVQDEPVVWAFQREIEEALYGNGYASQTGAVYRLLQRSGAGGRALPLKRACVAEGLVTHDEFEWMYSHLTDVRSFTLIPIDALQLALATFGSNARSEALAFALSLDRPQGWDRCGGSSNARSGEQDRHGAEHDGADGESCDDSVASTELADYEFSSGEGEEGGVTSPG